MSWVSKPESHRVGDNFPRPDPSKGRSLGWNFEKKEYRYETEWPKGKPIPENGIYKKSKKHQKVEEEPYIPQVDEDIDPQEVRDYYGY